MRARPLRPAALLALAALATGAVAQPYREALAVPSYRLFAAMLDQVSQGSGVEGMGRPLQILAPLIEALDRKYEVRVRERLDGAVAARNASAAGWAIVGLVLLDAQDLIDSARRDELVGWEDAKVATRKARLDYFLVSARLRPRHPGRDERIREGFDRLLRRLAVSDLTTNPEVIEVERSSLAAELSGLRAALDQEGASR
jgi:hypothetical protein